MSDFTAPICLKPRFSKRFAIILMILHCGTLLLLLPLTLPLPIELALASKFCVGFFILANAFYVVRRHLFLINHPLYGCFLTYNSENHDIKAQLSSQREAIVSGSYSYSELVVLRLKIRDNGSVHALVIFSDALDAQTFRRLRMLLLQCDIDLSKDIDLFKDKV
jgi:hypothetical protein